MSSDNTGEPDVDVLDLAQRLFLASYAMGRDQRDAARSAITGAATFADEWNALTRDPPEPQPKKRAAK